MSKYDDKSMAKGEKGEEFFKNLGAWGLFMLPPMEDNRGNHWEGDFTMHDGSVVEIKTDYRCLSTECNKDGKPLKTGRIPIEMQRRKKGASEWKDGWYWHCKRNDVSYLLFYLYRNEAVEQPFMGILIEMKSLVEFISRVREDKQYAEQVGLRTAQAVDWVNGDSTRLYTFPIEAIRAHCTSWMQHNISYPAIVSGIPDVLKDTLQQIVDAHGGGRIAFDEGMATFQPDDGSSLHESYVSTEMPPGMTLTHISDGEEIIATAIYEEVENVE